MNFKKKKKTKLKTSRKKAKKDTLESLFVFFDGREMVLNRCKSKICPLLPIQGIWHPSKY